MNTKKNLSLYFHIPFCTNRCYYCDFYSTTNLDLEIRERYKNAIIKSLDLDEKYQIKEDYFVDTIYFGGGTPTELGSENIVEIIKKCSQKFNLASELEITVETNPNNITLHDFKLLKEGGVNRISIGVQSFDDEYLDLLGRRHTPREAEECIELCAEAGFKNISIDLMFGLPDQTPSDFYRDIEKLADFSDIVQHISLYNLRLEENTKLFNQRNFYSFLDDDAEAEMYYNAVQSLKSLGFIQYEISNFAKQGFYSRHNMKYWDGGDFLGFGASAHSRFKNKLFDVSPDVNKFIENIEGEKNLFEICGYEDIKPMNEEECDDIYIMMSLRTTNGLDSSRLFDFDRFYKKAERLIKSGFLSTNNKRFWIREDALFVSNPIISSLI